MSTAAIQKKRVATQDQESSRTVFDGLAISSVIYIALLFAAFLVSLFNIQELAAQNHAMPAVSWLLAVFVSGTAAITVYVAVIAKTPALRRLATWLGIGFAVVSAVLQVTMYLTLETPIGAAIGFGVGVPIMEAFIAWLEGSISIERATLAAGDKPSQEHEELERLRFANSEMNDQLQELRKERMRLTELEAKARVENERLKAHVTDLRVEVAEAKGRVAAARAKSAPAKSGREKANVVIDWETTLQSGEVSTATDLRRVYPSLGERTAQRRISDALDAGLIARSENGVLYVAHS